MKRSLRFEQLEKREMLASVAAVMNKGSLSLVGDFQADSVSISPGPNYMMQHDLLVKGYAGTKVNGQDSVIIVGVVKDVNVACFGAGCTIAIGGIKLGDPTLTLPGNVAVFSGSGKQDVIVTNANVTRSIGVTTFAKDGETILGVPSSGFSVPAVLGADNVTGPLQVVGGVFVMGGLNSYRVNVSQILVGGGLGVMGGSPSLVSIQDTIATKGTTCAFGFAGTVNVDVDNLNSQNLVVMAWSNTGTLSIDGSNLGGVTAFLGKGGWTTNLGMSSPILVSGAVVLIHVGPETLNQGLNNQIGMLIDVLIQPQSY